MEKKDKKNKKEKTVEKKNGKINRKKILIILVPVLFVFGLIFIFIMDTLIFNDDFGYNNIEDYVVLKNVPDKFKNNFQSSSTYDYYFVEGELNDNSCTATIGLSAIESAEKYAKTYQRENSYTGPNTVNDIDWFYFTFKDDSSESKELSSYHVYVSDIQGQTVVFSLGYTGTNSEKCFDHEEDFLKSIYLAK